MIDQDMVTITAALMKHRTQEVREQAALLMGSFATHSRASPHMISYTFKNLNEILEDKEQSVRNAAAVVFKKLSLTPSGRECIRDSNSAVNMI